MRNATRVLAAALVLFIAACAAKQESGTTTPAAATQAQPAGIRVINDGTAFRDMTVFLIPDSGVKEMLGEVKAGETKVFQHELRPGNYTLEQQRADGTSRSGRFYVTTDSKLVIWTVSNNRVQVTK